MSNLELIYLLNIKTYCIIVNHIVEFRLLTVIIKEIKQLILDRDFTLTDLANELSKKLNKKYTMANLSQILRNETIPYREIKLIAEILDYDIKFIDKRKRY